MTNKLIQSWLLVFPALMVGCGLVKRDPNGDTPWTKNDSIEWLDSRTSPDATSPERSAEQEGERTISEKRLESAAPPAGFQDSNLGGAESSELDRSIQDSILTLIENTDDPELKRMLIGNMHAFYGNRPPAKLEKAVQGNAQEERNTGSADSPQRLDTRAEAPIGTGIPRSNSGPSAGDANRNHLSEPAQHARDPAHAPDPRHALKAEQERQLAGKMLAEIEGSMNGMMGRQLDTRDEGKRLPAATSTGSNLLDLTSYDSDLQQRWLEGSDNQSSALQDPLKTSARTDPTQLASIEKDAVPLGRWKQHLLQSIATLEAASATPQRSLTHQERTNAELTLRFLYMLTANRDRALQPIEGLSETENAYWKEQLFAISELIVSSDVDLQSTMFTTNTQRNAIAVQHERAALGHLADSAMLQVRNLNLCRSIEGFGAFETFPSTTFEKNQKVLVYCELENLTARETVGAKYQQYESELRGTVTIHNSDRKVVEETTYETVRDVCRNRRLDFYVYFEWQVPSDLPAGDYYLQVTIEDRLGDKTSSSPAPFAFRVR